MAAGSSPTVEVALAAMDGRPRKMREGNVRIVPPPAMAFITPAPKEAATRINAWGRFIGRRPASDRLDQPGRGLGGLPAAEDVLPASVALHDHLAQGFDDPVEPRANGGVGDPRLLGDRLQVAAREDEHLDEALVLQWEPGQARRREAAIDGDRAGRTTHPGYLHRPVAIGTEVGDRFHILGSRGVQRDYPPHG